MIIDAWSQHPTLRHLGDPMFDSLRRWTKEPAPAHEMPVSATVAAMDGASVALALISAWVGPGGAMISNDEVAAFVAQRRSGSSAWGRWTSRGRCRPCAKCGAVHQLGFKAIRVLPWLWQRPPTDRLFYPVYAACVETDVPFCTQIGHTGPLMPSEVGRPIYLDQVALDFPELRIVGGHIGYPWTDEAVAVATKHENVFIDTSAYTVRRYPAPLVEFMRSHGRRKVLFGTNYPMILPEKALEGLDALGLDDEARALFLAGNASRVFAL